MKEILIRNRQRACRLRTLALAQVVTHLLEIELGLERYALGIQLVGRRRITVLNQHWLRHAGPTDVITFDHRPEDMSLQLYGEIYLCPPQAVIQARQFHLPWTIELVRHLVHGVLHLQGYLDHTSVARTRMKRREDQLLRRLRHVIDLAQISSEPCASL